MSKLKVMGIGVMDVKGGSRYMGSMCKMYQCWQAMLVRCVNHPDFHYKPLDYFVSEEWLTYSVFKKWMGKQNWKGKCLAKEIRCSLNVRYSKETCLFVTKQVQAAIRRSMRGEYPGAHYAPQNTNKPYTARIHVLGVYTYLGAFKTKYEASIVYNRARADYLQRLGEGEEDKKVCSALLGLAETCRKEARLTQQEWDNQKAMLKIAGFT